MSNGNVGVFLFLQIFYKLFMLRFFVIYTVTYIYNIIVCRDFKGTVSREKFGVLLYEVLLEDLNNSSRTGFTILQSILRIFKIANLLYISCLTGNCFRHVCQFRMPCTDANWHAWRKGKFSDGKTLCCVSQHYEVWLRTVLVNFGYLENVIWTPQNVNLRVVTVCQLKSVNNTWGPVSRR